MHLTIHGLLLVVLACLLMSRTRADLHSVEKRRASKLDCTRFVFAPQCRGVAAKRDLEEGSVIDDDISESDFVDEMILKSFIALLRNQDSVKEGHSSVIYHPLLGHAVLGEETRDVLDDLNDEETFV